MQFSDFVRNIRFRYLQPGRKRPIGLRKLNSILRSFGYPIDVINTRLPDRDAETKKLFRKIQSVPRMSTFAVGAIVNRAVREMRPGSVFVNVGVWHGFSFFCGMVGNENRRCLGIDNFSHRHSPRETFLKRFREHASDRHEFFEMEYREYFRKVHDSPIGCYLFDGPHREEDQWDALEFAEPFFADNCIVVIDDSNWPQVKETTLRFFESSRNKYEILLDAHTSGSGHPTFWNGVLVVRFVRRKLSESSVEKSLDVVECDIS